jgi:uncharacterized protein (DUF1778 family)
MSSVTSNKGSENSHPGKNARLEVQIAEEEKELLLAAAQIAGCSLTDFVVSSAIEIARRTVQDYEVMRLSPRDREVFVAALLNPPDPGDKLQTSASRYKKRMGL